MDLTKETNFLVFYGTLIIGISGLYSNLMNMRVSTSPKIQKTTMGFFNILLSIFNILLIVFVGFLCLFPQSVGRPNIVISSNAACKLLPYFTRIVSQMSSWLSVLTSLDRLFILMKYSPQNNVRDPQEKRNKKKLTLIIMCLFFVLCIINMPNLFFELDSQLQLCTANKALVLLRDIVGKGSYGVLPLIIQIGVSAILVFRLKKLKSIIHTVSIKREIKYTFSVIMFNMIFILSDIIGSISIVFANIYGYNETTYISTQSNEAAISSFVYVCSVYLNMFCVCVLLFFINLGTNKRFRKEATKMLGRRINE